MMEVVGVIAMIFVLGGFTAGAVSLYNRQVNQSLERSPGVALATGDHWYKQSLRLARLLSKIQSDELVWPVVSEPIRLQVEAELERFWEESSK